MNVIVVRLHVVCYCCYVCSCFCVWKSSVIQVFCLLYMYQYFSVILRACVCVCVCVCVYIHLCLYTCMCVLCVDVGLCV